MGFEIDGFEGVHGGFGFGKRNVEGEIILETADALNTWFKKEEFFHICPEKVKRKMVRDVKVVKVECINHQTAQTAYMCF